MISQKKILAVSHCILNQHVVINNWERADGGFPIAHYLLEKGIAFLQLPCPEFLILGPNRPPMSYEEYDSLDGYREKTRELLLPTITQLKMYEENGYDYLGLMGINESPTCSITGQRGILMEEFFELCAQERIPTHFMEIPTWYSEENEGNIKTLVNTFLGDENDVEEK